MPLHKILPLLLLTFIAASSGAESFSGGISFGSTSDHSGEFWFTALDPGDTASSLPALSGYSQAASTDYTYLYLLENTSSVGTPTSFGNEHSFYGIDLETLFDPNGPAIHSVGFDSSNGGEEPSFFDLVSPDLISIEFDNAPNYGVTPDGGVSAFLRFYSPFGPSSLGGAYFTQNTPGGDFTYLSTGVTTPVPEPGSAALLALGLLSLGLRRGARAH